MKDSQDETNTSNCLTKLFYPCVNFLSFLNIGQIHPLEPVTPLYSEYVSLDLNKKIRVIHVKPKTTIVRDKLPKTDKRVSRTSLSEEYWFTQWSKRLRSDVCNCSFRRSARFSKVSDEFTAINTSFSRRDTYNSAFCTAAKSKTKLSSTISYIEEFVETFVEDTLFEAFREYCNIRNSNLQSVLRDNDVVSGSSINDVPINFIKNSGVDNLAFIPVDDDTVQIRWNKISEEASHFTECGTSCKDIQISEAPKCTTAKKRLCIHGQTSGKVKPLVLLLHGIGSSADVWWGVINSLQNKGYEVVAPDMLGHGFSSVPNQSKEYSFKNLLNNTLAIFETYLPIGQTRKCILIGHSFGCGLATAVYKYKSQQIAQMVLISGGGPTPLVSSVTENVTLFTCLQTLFKPLLFCGLKRSFFYSSRGKHFTCCEQNNAIPEYVLQHIYKGQNWPEGDAAYHRRIMIPTLLVHGLQDTKVTLVQECEMERTIPRSFLELLPNAGHMAMLEAPEQLSHMILCFIDCWSC